MFDPGAGPAILLLLGHHFAVEEPVQATAQEGEDILGGEVHRGVVHQPRVEFGKGRFTAEDDIRGKLGLIDHPAIRCPAQPTSSQMRIDPSRPTGQLSLPILSRNGTRTAEMEFRNRSP